MKHFFSDEAMERLMAEEREVHHGGMIALVPAAEDANRLAVAGFEPASVLHVTLFFLGETVWPFEVQQDLFDLGGQIADRIDTKVVGDLWASASFNPMGEDPCAVYLVGGASVSGAHDAVLEAIERFDGKDDLAPQHRPWVPHLTIGYGLSNSVLDEFGPVTFDRVRVSFGEGNDIDHWLN